MNRNKFTIFLRAIAITLLTAVVFYIAGYRLVYTIVVHEAKEDAGLAISNHENIKEITMSAKDYSTLEWTEKSKEFTLNKQMYDLVSLQKSGDTYILKVYCDKNETQWVDVMNDYSKWIASVIENLLNTFEKGYDIVHKFKVVYTPKADTVKYHYIADSCHPVTTEPIWHPPAC